MYFFSFIVVPLVVCSSALKNSEVSSGEIRCVGDEPIEAQVVDDGHGIFRIKVCACSVDDLNVAVAESEETCQSAGIHLEWDRNATVDSQCEWTKPLNFDPHGFVWGTLVMCSSSSKDGPWKKSIPLLPSSL